MTVTQTQGLRLRHTLMHKKKETSPAPGGGGRRTKAPKSLPSSAASAPGTPSGWLMLSKQPQHDADAASSAASLANGKAATTHRHKSRRERHTQKFQPCPICLKGPDDLLVPWCWWLLKYIMDNNNR